jgi:hypothetical protein
VYDKNKLQKGKPKQQSNAPLEALEQLWKGPVEDSFMKTVNARREARVQARSTSCDASKPSRGRPQAKAADEKKQKKQAANWLEHRNSFRAPFKVERVRMCLGIFCLMTLSKNRTYASYFRAPRKGSTQGSALISSLNMSYREWAEIFRCIDVDDNFEELCAKACREAWILGREVCIDESISPHNHRQNPNHVFVQRKPWQHGLKYFTLADTSQYLYNFFLAKRSDAKVTDPCLKRQCREPVSTKWRGKKLTHPVPEIFEKLIGDEEPGHAVFADSYFGGYEPMLKLSEMGHTGLLCCQEKRPSALFRTGLAPFVNKLEHHGEFVSGTGLLKFGEEHEGTIPFSVFGVKARKRMYLFSTEHSPNEVVDTTELTNPDENDPLLREEVMCTVPKARKDYLTVAGSVDGANREVLISQKQLHKFMTVNGSKFFWLFRVLCHDAHVIDDFPLAAKRDTQTFLEMLGRQLCGLDAVETDQPDKISDHSLILHTKPTNCAICYWKKNKKIKANNRCGKCDVSMHRHCHQSIDHADFTLAGGKNRPKKSRK